MPFGPILTVSEREGAEIEQTVSYLAERQDYVQMVAEKAGPGGAEVKWPTCWAQLAAWARRAVAAL